MQSISRLAPFMCIAATLTTPFLRPPPTLLASGEFYALCARVELTEAVVLRVLCSLVPPQHTRILPKRKCKGANFSGGSGRFFIHALVSEEETTLNLRQVHFGNQNGISHNDRILQRVSESLT